MNKMRNLLLISSSKVHGYGYLEAAEDEIKDFLSVKNVQKILFIPYASRRYDDYLSVVSPPFTRMGFRIESIHQHENPIDAINSCQAIFIGGGNTFLLLKTLYENNLIETIRKRVFLNGIPYMGSSAGTNVATRSINTTNDMPIVYPPSFNALELVPFNINPHYIETESTTHKGETRDERIFEYIEMPDARPVLGLREGCMLRVTGDKAVLKGLTSAKVFSLDKKTDEYPVNSDLSFLLNIS